MREAKVIPYHLIKHIIVNCHDERVQALMAFQYAMGNRAGELAREYNHKKQKWKKKEKKLVEKGRYKSEGARRDQFFETKDGLEWESPNFKNARQPTKRAWVFKSEQWLYDILKKWLGKKKDATHLFNLKHSRIKGLIDSELKKYDAAWHSHCLRHSRATHIGSLTGNPYVVKQVLGHARLETSTRYVNIAMEEIKAKLAGRNFEEVLGREV